MSRLFERIIESTADRLVLLAPAQSTLTGFNQVEANTRRRTRFLHTLQRLRGQVYLQDAAIGPNQLTADHRYVGAHDDRSWHLFTLNAKGKVTGCGWYLEHPAAVTVSDLRARECPLAFEPSWRSRLREALSDELSRATSAGLGFVEFGGWAVARELASVTDSLLIFAAGFSLGRLRGGAIGLTTATVRHCSSTILRRLGGLSLGVDGTTIPTYFDPRYGCEMELLKFDSRTPDPRYADLIACLTERLADVRVIAPSAPTSHHSMPLFSWEGGLETSALGSVTAS